MSIIYYLLLFTLTYEYFQFCLEKHHSVYMMIYICTHLAVPFLFAGNIPGSSLMCMVWTRGSGDVYVKTMLTSSCSSMFVMEEENTILHCALCEYIFFVW
jgi:hypothetical protein